ncbi:hypothetical protein J6590_031885 [Homalodisca vitripennis]|nr:hypothetical protein J6590_031885 [Homalodisca vitripennis]
MPARCALLALLEKKLTRACKSRIPDHLEPACLNAQTARLPRSFWTTLVLLDEHKNLSELNVSTTNRSGDIQVNFDLPYFDQDIWGN